MANILSAKNFRILLLGSALVLFTSGGLKNKSDQVAVFDNFIYKGVDDFYINHPLSGSDYFYNPILPGWYSDPSICSNGEDYFMVTSSFSYFPGVPIFHSRDLMNWKQIGFILNRESQLPLKGQRTSGGIFAPAISYNPHNQTYYMITTNVGAGNFFVKTKNPFGEWSDPVWLRDVKGIDPSFFFDDDGKAYVVNNDAPEGPALYDGHRAIWVQEFDVNSEKMVGQKKVLINGGIHPEEKPIWIEGPHLYKINDHYYLMAAEGGTGPQHSEVILRGDNPMGPFVAWDKNPILTQRHLDPQRSNPITCAGHADLIQKKDGSWWGVFLACRPIDGRFENLGRETFLLPVRWSEDGFPYMTRGDDLISMMVQMPGVERQSNVTFGNFECVDDFNSNQLSMSWLSLRSSAQSSCSLSDKPGYLTMKCSEVSASDTGTPSFLGRRMQHHKFECSTTLTRVPQREKSMAGLLLYKDEFHQYFLSVEAMGSSGTICLEKIGRSGSEKLACKPIHKNKQIQLKVVGRGTYYDFYFSLGKNKWNLLIDNVDAGYLSTANAGGFTGTTIGLYAVQKR